MHSRLSPILLRNRKLLALGRMTYSRMLPNGISPSSYTIPLEAPPENWKSLAPFPAVAAGTDAKAQTYAQQGSLPHLPIPPLGRTLEKLKSSLRAMARDENEYAVAIAKIDAFGQAKGPGEVLQKRLEERKVVENKERGSWLEAWWDDLAYMGYRDSVSLFSFSQTPSHSITGGHQRFILLYVHRFHHGLTNDPNRRIRPPTINAHPTAANLLRHKQAHPIRSEPRSIHPPFHPPLPPTTLKRSNPTRRSQRRCTLHGFLALDVRLHSRAS